MKPYQSSQPMWMLLASLPPIMLLLAYLYLTQKGTNPMPLGVLLAMEGLFMLATLLFYELRITVTADLIELRYGIGWIRKTIRMADIQSVSTVRNKWYYGLGIRMIPKGMLYNAHGLDAVELRFWNTQRVIRIGSPESERLKREIEQRMNTLV